MSDLTKDFSNINLKGEEIEKVDEEVEKVEEEVEEEVEKVEPTEKKIYLIYIDGDMIGCSNDDNYSLIVDMIVGKLFLKHCSEFRIYSNKEKDDNGIKVSITGCLINSVISYEQILHIVEAKYVKFLTK
jgi:hypothetical protein